MLLSEESSLHCDVCCCVDSPSNFPFDFLQRILPDIGRRRDRKDALGGRSYQVDDGRRRSAGARRSDIRACQPGKQLRRDVSQRCRLPVWRAHQLPLFHESPNADKLDAAARWQKSSGTRVQRHREIGFLPHAAVRTSCGHRRRQRRLVAEVYAGSSRPSSGKWYHYHTE